MGGPAKNKDELLKELDHLMRYAWSASLNLDSKGKIHKEVEYLKELIDKEIKARKIN